MFSLEEYTHFTPGKAAALFGTFVLAVLGLCVAVGYTYPDKKSAPRTWPDGLEKELGGKGALLVSLALIWSMGLRRLLIGTGVEG